MCMHIDDRFSTLFVIQLLFYRMLRLCAMCDRDGVHAQLLQGEKKYVYELLLFEAAYGIIIAIVGIYECITDVSEWSIAIILYSIPSFSSSSSRRNSEISCV